MATLVTSLCFALLVCSAAAESLDSGFTIELIPRHSPNSPLYDPQETPSQRVTRLMNHRPNALREPSELITNMQGAYSINIMIGTPPVKFAGIADTGSDLMWTQCHPCKSCFPQAPPFYNPSVSTTYADVLYDSTQCKLYDGTMPSSEGPTCLYHVLYSDRSYSLGKMASESIILGSTLGDPIILPNIVFGCGYNNGGSFKTHISGIIGLGGGDASLVSQLGSRTGGKFSYCLVTYFSQTKVTSKLNFGSKANVVGSGVVSTPLVQKAPKTFYHVTLEGISVNGRKFEVSGSSERGPDEGNIVIDSGTTLTILRPDLYHQIAHAVFEAIPLPTVPDPTNSLSLCYESTSLINRIPQITVHFTGADVVLKWYNIFVNVASYVTCFGFVPGSSDLSVYGNLAQMNFLVGFDLTKHMVSFKLADCTAH